MKKKTFVLSLGCVLVLLLSTGVFAENDSIPLANEDCVKCHVEEVTDIEAHGALHKTEVGCNDCHVEHPPEGQETIAGCDSCHPPEDNVHYALQNCKVCHHPHHPRDMDFSKIDPVKPACLSCHPGPDQQMQAYPSKHAELDCKKCHLAHREATACIECHDAHSPDMTAADCMRCHKPHRPAAIQYEGPVPEALCAGCHSGVVADVTGRGAAHKDVACIDCHAEHPPAKKGIIAACTQCHAPADKAHYTLENCIACHYPHYPMEMDFTKIDPVKPACQSCHPGPDEQMQAYPSKHAELDCKQCHLVHREATACLKCHDPHSSKMTSADCKRCHQPHMPVEVTYGDDISSTFCAGCHAKVSKNLVRTKTKHRSLECIYCHKHRHKKAFGCDTCHGEPHDFDIHAGYPDCLKCHEDPHALVK